MTKLTKENDFIADSESGSFLFTLKNRGLLEKIIIREKISPDYKFQKSIYLGIDPSSRCLHLGHLIPLATLQRISSKLKLRGIVVIGKSTVLIGDPSDQLKKRKSISLKEVQINTAGIFKQISNLFHPRRKSKKKLDLILKKINPKKSFFSFPILANIENKTLRNKIQSLLPNGKANKKGDDNFYDIKSWEKIIIFSKNNPPEIMLNSQWLGRLRLINFLERFIRLFPINSKLINRRRVRSKKETNFPLSELLYPVIQAYDFFFLLGKKKCLAQIGGKDQLTNITLGLDLIKKKSKNEEWKKTWGVTTPLLIGKNKEKVGKTNSRQEKITIPNKTDNAFTFYHQLINLSDNSAKLLLNSILDIPNNSWEMLANEILKQPKEKIAQKILAEALTTHFFGKKELWLILNLNNSLYKRRGQEKKYSKKDIKIFIEALTYFSLTKTTSQTTIGKILLETEIFTKKRNVLLAIKNKKIKLDQEQVESFWDKLVFFKKKKTFLLQVKKNFYVIQQKIPKAL